MFVEFEKCPSCGWSIILKLANRIRRCCGCGNEWTAVEQSTIDLTMLAIEDKHIKYVKDPIA
jgi:ribosomal protein L37AE/L43A